MDWNPVVWSMTGAVAAGSALMGFLHWVKRPASKVALRESWTGHAAAAAALGLWEWDVARDRFRLSEPGRVLLGCSRAAPGPFADFLEQVHREDGDALRRGLAQAVQSQAPFGMDFRVVVSEGAERWIRLHGRANRDDRGRTIVSGACMDVTECRQTEARLLREQHRADREAALLRRELAHLSRVAMLGELSGSIAHELNQPLAAILSNAQAAQRFLAHGIQHVGEVREILSDIVDDDRRAGEVIKHLRVLLKKDETHYNVLEINELVRDVLRLMRSDLLNRSVTLSTDLAPALPVLRGDSIQLQQVMLNLLMNGCEAMETAAPSRRQILVRTRRNGDRMIEIAVVDRGAGISEDRLERIFDPFVTTKSSGIGLGLTVCRTIVESHGGWIRASNGMTGGAEFCLALPAHGEYPDAR